MEKRAIVLHTAKTIPKHIQINILERYTFRYR